MEQKEDKILDHIFRPDAKIELDLNQYSVIMAALKPFEMAVSILNDARQTTAQKPGILIPIRESDVEKNEKGEILIQNNNVVIKKEFWEKLRKESSGNNSVTVEDIKEQ